MSIDKNSIPKAFQKALMNDEEVLAVTQKHSLWILGWWLNPINWILVLMIIGIFVFLYKLYVMKNEVIILTNKRVIGSVNPKLFTKDKIELTLKAVDNIKEDETLFGNIFGWTAIKIESRSAGYIQRQVTKNSVSNLKNKFYEQQK